MVPSFDMAHVLGRQLAELPQVCSEARHGIEEFAFEGFNERLMQCLKATAEVKHDSLQPPRRCRLKEPRGWSETLCLFLYKFLRTRAESEDLPNLNVGSCFNSWLVRS